MNFVKNTETSFNNVKLALSDIESKAIPKPMFYRNGNFSVFDSNGDLQDSSYFVNDNFKNYNILWSSEKIDSLLPKIDDSVKSSNTIWSSNKIYSLLPKIDDSTHGPQTLWSSEKINNLIPKIDDSSPPKSNIIYSSAKQKNLIDDANSLIKNQINEIVFQNNLPSGKMNVVLDAPYNTLALFDDQGQVKSANVVIDDTLVGKSVIWTSDKIKTSLNSFVEKPLVYGSENFAILDQDGQVYDSGLNKFNFIKSVPGNNTIPLLTENGQLADSQSDINMLMLKYRPIIPNSIPLLDNSGQIIDSGLIINDASAPNANVLWSSQKLNSSFVLKPTGGNYNNVLSYDYNGNIVAKNPFGSRLFFLTSNLKVVYDDYLQFWFDNDWDFLCCSLLDLTPKNSYSLSALLLPKNLSITSSGLIPFKTDAQMLKITNFLSGYLPNDSITVTLITSFKRLYRITIILGFDSSPTHAVNFERLS